MRKNTAGSFGEHEYEKFYSLMIVNTEQLYADIFVGNLLNTTFLSDIKAMNWFLYHYK